MKQNLIRAVDLIGKSLHPDHLKKNYPFEKKTSLINHMQAYMKGEGKKELNNETRALALQACATLVYPFIVAVVIAGLLQVLLQYLCHV